MSNIFWRTVFFFSFTTERKAELLLNFYGFKWGIRPINKTVIDLSYLNDTFGCALSLRTTLPPSFLLFFFFIQASSIWVVWNIDRNSACISNKFSGWLCDATRSALVFEHCSRGSLQDVLMMDEIKLDWSFRLSLLTDMVRGMKYLHSSPLRVHGSLSSRNCVVDARWVLKLTDYGLHQFYEAQGVPTPSKTAKRKYLDCTVHLLYIYYIFCILVLPPSHPKWFILMS